MRLRDALRPIAQRQGTTVAAVSVAWTLSWPGVTGTIVGVRSAEQVDGWIRAGEIELTQQDLDEIAPPANGSILKGAAWFPNGVLGSKRPSGTIPAAALRCPCPQDASEIRRGPSHDNDRE